MTTLELLVGADLFWSRASADLAHARRRVFVQAMTFEGDKVGQTVAGAIARSPALDRRVLVDAYSRMTVSDRAVYSLPGLFDRALRAEVRATDAMFKGLNAAGARVRVTNPIGLLLANYPARNHKKLIVADDVAYLGGVNFSDHNFAWTDFMLRLEGEAAADFLAADFDATFKGRPRNARLDQPSLRLISLDGRDNAPAFGEIMALIDRARAEIVVLSAYLTFPVTEALARAARRGVRVRLITPLANNKPTVRDYLLAAAAAAGFEVTLLSAMSHLKGLLIDGEILICGSSNFDFVSLAAEEEYLVVSRDLALIADFQARIIKPSLAEVVPVGVAPKSSGRFAYFALKVAERVALSARGSRRTAVDWR